MEPGRRRRWREVTTTHPPPWLTMQQSRRCSGAAIIRDASTCSTVMSPFGPSPPADATSPSAAARPRPRRAAPTWCRTRACGGGPPSRSPRPGSCRAPPRTGSRAWPCARPRRCGRPRVARARTRGRGRHHHHLGQAVGDGQRRQTDSRGLAGGADAGGGVEAQRVAHDVGYRRGRERVAHPEPLGCGADEAVDVGEGQAGVGQAPCTHSQ